MKSMKLASGFAISALAMAIAGTATAQTTTEVDFTGSVKARTVLDLENETRVNELEGTSADSLTEDWFHLEAAWTITNGPFSGNLLVGFEADDDATAANVRIEDLIVEEGPISFGQIGSIADTAGLLEGLTDFDASDETALDYDVDGGARYTFADFGLRVQAEGEEGGDNFGLAAAITQDLDVAQVWADVQYREAVNAAEDGMEDGTVAYGLGVVATPVDLVTLTAAFRGDTDEAYGDGTEATTAYGVRADVSVTDTISVFALFADNETAIDDNAAFQVGGSVGFAPVTLSASYQAKAAEAGDGQIEAKADYSQDAIGAYVEVTHKMEDFLGQVEAGTEVVLGSTYTTASGIVYGGEYTNAAEEFDGETVNQFEAYAQYSF